MYGWTLMGDREWVAACLQERLLHPELYESREDMAAVVDKLRRQLADGEGGRERQSHGGAYPFPSEV